MNKLTKDQIRKKKNHKKKLKRENYKLGKRNKILSEYLKNNKEAFNEMSSFISKIEECIDDDQQVVE